MLTASARLPPETKVWRYIRYSRFVWLLQKKQLWFSRADHLGDPWEISLAGDQLKHVISRHPMSPIGEPMRETALQRSERIINAWRRKTFINCWSASDHESHALWRIYCQTCEGVAIQTTLGKLQASVGDLPVYECIYAVPGSSEKTPTLEDLATKKRPMFSYEREVRILHVADNDCPEPIPVGFGIPWDVDENVESIRVHPEADQSFMETVVGAIESYAPASKDIAVWSDMNESPPF